MAMKVKVEIKNRERLNAKLAKMAKGMGGSGLERGINMATAVVSGRAKALAPVDTGHLRASIHPKKAEVQGDEITGAVVAGAEHAIYVEFGTGVKANGSYPYPTQVPLSYSSKDKWTYTTDGGKKFKTAYSKPARPFLGRALHESERDIDRIVIAGFRKSLGGGK